MLGLDLLLVLPKGALSKSVSFEDGSGPHHSTLGAKAPTVSVAHL